MSLVANIHKYYCLPNTTIIYTKVHIKSQQEQTFGHYTPPKEDEMNEKYRKDKRESLTAT